MWRMSRTETMFFIAGVGALILLLTGILGLLH